MKPGTWLLLSSAAAVAVLAGSTWWVTHDTTPAANSHHTRAASLTGARLKSCEKRLIADYFDNGGMSRVYPLACYGAVVASLDGLDYSPTKDVQRALDFARQGKIAGASPAYLAQQAATGIFAQWNAALRSGAVEQPKRVFHNPPFPVLRQRLRDAAREHGFQIERIYIRWPRQQAPYIVVRTSDPTRFVRALPAFLRKLDPKQNTGVDRTGWAYEGFYLQALDQTTGQPFLIVFNNWRGYHPGGGQWASDPKLLPFPHG